MQLLFMSNLFPKETKKAVQAKMQFNMYDAADVLQWNLINGFEANGAAVSLINLLPVDSWPQYYQNAFVKRHTFAHKAGATDINVGYCNIKYIKRLFAKHSYWKEIKKWERKSSNNDRRIVLAYSLNSNFVDAIKAIKRKDPYIKAVAIVADLPEFTTSTRNILRRIYRKFHSRRINKNLDVFDGFILLTEQMALRMQIQLPYIVMEGIASDRKRPAVQTKMEKTIFYSGSLNIKYGVSVLLEAFAQIEDPDMKMILCGLGDGEELVQQYAQNDPRIHFMGKIPHEQVLQLQQQATVLVNPRQNNEEYTKYSFPSKTMEYLASGVPVVAYKLDGIPDEYDEYLNYVEDNSAQRLADKLVQICEMDEASRAEMGKRGADFVIKNKNAVVQTRRILEFINETCNPG